MQYYARAFAVALLGSIAFSTYAADAQIARMDWTSTFQDECKSGECNGKAKLAFSSQHSFDVPANVIQGIGTETVVTMTIGEFEVSFKMVEDPNYTAGATSARVSKSIPLEFYEGSIEFTAQLNWTSDHMQVELQGHGAGVSTGGIKMLKNKDLQGEIFAAPLITKIETENVATFEQWDEVPVDYIARGSSTEVSNGDGRYKRSDVLKTVELVN
jgi:hypothetical protein